MLRHSRLPKVVLVAGMLVSGVAQADDLAAIRALIGEFKVGIEHQETLTEAKDGKPPIKSDSWTFKAGGVNPAVGYGRYLNRPPDFTGSHPSLTGGDMGIGLNGGPFQYWYSGSALRVLLDGRDLFAEQSATLIETQEGVVGHLRLTWELENDRRLRLHFAVPGDGRAVFARIDFEPGAAPLSRIELRLICYPGGYLPAYSQPSHRYAKTAKGAGEVPRDFKPSGENPYPVVALPAGEEWVFYGDQWCSSGSLALLVNREEQPAGQVNLSNYGVSTSLIYPPGTRQIHMVFFAYSLENEAAEKAFLAGLDSERQTLRSIPFWP